MMERFENVIKSPHDKRKYRGLVLQNQMKVLLISDSEAELSAAALGVNVGSMSDPDELPGLAHFCEHMLFLGTEKYPKEDEYMKFIQEHAGYCNAYTSLNETVFGFSVGPDHLMGALDRFAQFFIAPLFTESATERETNAVNSEFMMSLTEDSWRISELSKYLCDPNHPFHKFSCGNKNTLWDNPKEKGINVREALLNFHGKWYSSNIMTLAIVGKESLDDLEQLVEVFFSPIENKDVEAPLWKQHPYTSEQLATITKVVPIKDTRSLRMTFPMPDLRSYYKSAPEYYLPHLCGHEGAGSMLSVFKARGWSSVLMCDIYQDTGIGFFSICTDLTEKGLEQTELVIQVIFQYINMLKKEGPQKWIFDECTNISDIRFKFKEKEQPFSHVCDLTSSLRIYPFEHILQGPYVMSDYNADLLNSLMENCTPEQVCVMVIAKKFEPECTQEEANYGVKYYKEKISEAYLSKLKNLDLCRDLNLPLPNEFIPTDFSLKVLSNLSAHPEIIYDTSYCRVWYKQDSQFLMPKLDIYMIISSSYAYIDPLSCNLAHLFVDLLEDSLNEYSYDAALAGLSWHARATKQGIFIAIHGFHHKISVLFEKIIKQIKFFKIDHKRFDVLKENYVRSLKNFQADQPYAHTSYYTDILLSEHSWTIEELTETCNNVNVRTLEKYLLQLFSAIHIEILIHGNFEHVQAVYIGEFIEDTFNVSDLPPLFPQQMLNTREVKLEPGIQYIFEADHLHHHSSCTSVLYQCGVEGTENNMLLELLVQILNKPCFTTLRTKEQLGYLVRCLARRSNGAQGFRVIVQSDRLPAFVDERIEAFIDAMKTVLSTISNDEFQRHVDSLSTNRLEKPKTLSELTAAYWNEISSQQYHFNRDAVEVAFLRNVTKDQLFAFFMDRIEICGKNRSKLAIHITSRVNENKTLANEKSENSVPNCNKITDVVLFKSSLPLHPLVNFYIKISKKGFKE